MANNYIQRLPKDLLVEIVALVAASSLMDYFNVKLSCKMLKEAGEDTRVYEHMSLDEFPMSALVDKKNEAATSFMSRCMEIGNSNAFYIKGMIAYFALDDLAVALEYLTKSVQADHVGALYASCIILISIGESRGVQLLCAFKRSDEYMKHTIASRKNMAAFLRSIQIKNMHALRRPEVDCTGIHVSQRRKSCRFCDACLCHEEFGDLLRTIVVVRFAPVL